MKILGIEFIFQSNKLDVDIVAYNQRPALLPPLVELQFSQATL
jgi:hypothetical protein